MNKGTRKNKWRTGFFKLSLLFGVLVFLSLHAASAEAAKYKAESYNENGEVDILTILVKAGLEKSRGDARRDVVQGGVTVDGEKVQDFKAVFKKEELKDGKLVKRGKKSFKLVKS